MFKCLLFLLLLSSQDGGGHAQPSPPRPPDSGKVLVFGLDEDPMDGVCLRAYRRRMDAAARFAQALRDLGGLSYRRQIHEARLERAREVGNQERAEQLEEDLKGVPALIERQQARVIEAWNQYDRARAEWATFRPAWLPVDDDQPAQVPEEDSPPREHERRGPLPLLPDNGNLGEWLDGFFRFDRVDGGGGLAKHPALAPQYQTLRASAGALYQASVRTQDAQDLLESWKRRHPINWRFVYPDASRPIARPPIDHQAASVEARMVEQKRRQLHQAERRYHQTALAFDRALLRFEASARGDAQACLEYCDQQPQTGSQQPDCSPEQREHIKQEAARLAQLPVPGEATTVKIGKWWKRSPRRRQSPPRPPSPRERSLNQPQGSDAWILWVAQGGLLVGVSAVAVIILARMGREAQRSSLEDSATT